MEKKLEVISLDNSEKWDSIVNSFSDFDVYYLSSYVKAFKIHGDGEPLLFFYSDNECRGINVVMKRDIALDKHFKDIIPINTYYDFSTPYGYGGWIIEGDNTNKLFSEYKKWCKRNNVVSEFVRYHPVLGNQSKSAVFYDIVPLGETVSIDLSEKDTIWSNFSKKNRNVIRKAIGNHVQIKQGFSKKLIDEFINIYNQTMDKDNALNYYYFAKDFYESVRIDLANNSTIFYAEHEGKIIAMSLMIFANNYLNYHLSGSLKEYQHLAPSNLLLWEAAIWGHDHGFKSFHLGGGVGCKEDGLFKFKRAFYKGDLLKFYIGKCIFDDDVYKALCNLRLNNDNMSFFPLYRA